MSSSIDSIRPLQPGVAAAAPVIRLRNLDKVFVTDKVETHALAAIDLDVQPGDYVAITGPSGCGKSTLLLLLGLLDSPTAGIYELDGTAVDRIDAEQRARLRNQRIGFVFQSFNLVGDLTVRENVALPLRYRPGITRDELASRVEASLSRVDMLHRADHYPWQLSGGQQQRVAIARATVGRPSLILADEPTGNLDSHNGNAVLELLESLNEAGATLCIVTHDPAHAARATRQVRLFDGRLA